MPVINQVTAGGAVLCTITTPMSPSSPGPGGTFTISDATGWPTSGPVAGVIDRGQTNEEKVLGTLGGTTYTVSQRGYDGTVASTHTAGQATFELTLPATIVTATINHIDGIEANPHSGVLLNNAAHDVTARHQFGAAGALGQPVAPTVIVPDASANAGTGDNPSKEDHVHGIVAAAAVSITGSNTEGVSTSFARADHTHDLASGVVSLADINATDFALMFPSGVMWFYAGTAAPFGWLICDGSPIDRTTFAALFAVCGTAFGAGNGTTTFNIPDLRGRYPFGVATAGTGSTRGTTFGAIDHTHPLSSNGQAQLDGIASGSASPMWHRVGSAGWTANIQMQSTSPVVASSQVFSNATSLMGATDAANPPSVPANWIIKT